MNKAQKLWQETHQAEIDEFRKSFKPEDVGHLSDLELCQLKQELEDMANLLLDIYESKNGTGNTFSPKDSHN